MTGLMSADAFEAEHDHIREEINQTAGSLASRQTRWTLTTVGSLLLTVVLFGAGMAMVAIGALPDEVSLQPLAIDNTLTVTLPETYGEHGTTSVPTKREDPFAEAFGALTEGPLSVLTKLIGGIMLVMGFISGIARQSIMSFVTGIAGGVFMFQAPAFVENLVEGAVPASQKTGQVKPEWAVALEKAAKQKDWLQVQSLLAQHNIPDGVISESSLSLMIATEAVNAAIEDGSYVEALAKSADQRLQGMEGLTLLQAQLNYLGGQTEKAAEIVRENELFKSHEEDSWLIEQAGAAEKMSESSRSYQQAQMAMTSRGHTSLMGSGVMLILTIIAGLIMADLSRNLRKLDDWLKHNEPTEDSESNSRIDGLDVSNVKHGAGSPALKDSKEGLS